MHNSLRSVIARARAVHCVAFLPIAELFAAKRRLVAYPDPYYHRLARVMQVILKPISLYTTLYHPQLSVKKQTDELGSPRI